MQKDFILRDYGKDLRAWWKRRMLGRDELPPPWMPTAYHLYSRTSTLANIVLQQARELPKHCTTIKTKSMNSGSGMSQRLCTRGPDHLKPSTPANLHPKHIPARLLHLPIPEYLNIILTKGTYFCKLRIPLCFESNHEVISTKGG